MHGSKESRTVRLTRLLALPFVLMLGLGALAGCTGGGVSTSTGTPGPARAGSSATAFPLTVTDDASRTVTFAAPAARVVSLAPANTEIVYALGLFGRIVGVTTFDDYPAAVKDVAKVGDFQTPNIEAVASQSPDVVLVTGGVQEGVIAKLEATGAKVVVVDPRNIGGVFHAIGLVASILGVPEKGDSVVAGMKTDLAAIKAKLGASDPVKSFIEIGWNPLYTAGSGTLLDDLLTQAGGANIVSEKGYVGYSVEQLVQDQPEAYVGTQSSIGSVAALAKRPGYSALDAVKAGRVYVLTDDLVSRPGPRVVDGVREIAKALHPDLFQ
jgi:iron complex transport system substrate-binding protein